MAAEAVKVKLTQDDRVRIVNWIRDRGGDLFTRRATTDGKTPETMAKTLDQAFQEFVAGKGPSI